MTGKATNAQERSHDAAWQDELLASPFHPFAQPDSPLTQEPEATRRVALLPFDWRHEHVEH